MATHPLGPRLPRTFFARDTVVVARELLGQRLVRILDGRRVSGRICETEAYKGSEDQASHAYRRTPRSAIMYGRPGLAYIYLIYGMHYCLNAVTEPEGAPGAVLIRGIVPEEGVDLIRGARPRAGDRHLTDGPAKLCQALGITTALNGVDLTAEGMLFLEQSTPLPAAAIDATPRIGVHGDELARTRLWRFVSAGLADRSAI